jgi:uncharacterized membrane protein SirB2
MLAFDLDQGTCPVTTRMIEFYSQIRLAHIASVFASGLLFLVRGIAVQAGRADLALAPVPRYLSYAIDTTLLTAALMLVSIVPAASFSNGWLAAKLALLPVYVVCGWRAFRAPDRRQRAVFLALALFTYLLMLTIARAHHPLGLFRGLLSS